MNTFRLSLLLCSLVCNITQISTFYGARISSIYNLKSARFKLRIRSVPAKNVPADLVPINKADLQELRFSSCRCSSLNDATTVCRNAIDKKQDDCSSHAKVFISAAQERTMHANFMGHWFIGYFHALVQLESIVYLPRTSSYSAIGCRMCHFEVFYKKLHSTSDRDFVRCNSYNGRTFKQNTIKCPSRTTAVKLMNKMLTTTLAEQYLEICEIYAFGVIIVPKKADLQELRFSSCKCSSLNDATTVCRNAIDKKQDDCSSHAKVFISAAQERSMHANFMGHWFIGYFHALVQLDSIIYLPRTSSYSINGCRMCHFEIFYQKMHGTSDSDSDFVKCNSYNGLAFKRKMLKCAGRTTAVKLMNKRLTTTPTGQYLEICEIYASGVNLGP